MAEGIRQHDNPSPGFRADSGLGPRASGKSARECGVEIVDHHVEMDRRPVALVPATVIGRADRACGFLQQVEPRRPASELGGLRIPL